MIGRFAIALVAAMLGASTSAAATSVAGRAQSMLAAGDTTGAIRLLEGQYRHAHSPEPSILLGRLYRERGTIIGRLRSQGVLENARARFGHDPDVCMELGRTYFAQHFFPDAVSCFREVLAADPTRCDARYLLGLYHFQNWKRMNEYTDDLDDARRELRAVTSCDTTNADAAFKYLVTRFADGDTATTEATTFVDRFPDRPEFRLFRGTLYYDARRFHASATDYARGLALLDDATRAAYGDVERIMSYREKDRIEAISAGRRPDAVRSYWLNADPDPTTPINERELEHVRRMFVADALYSNAPSHKRGWETDRGEAFIKLGPPLSIKRSLGDDESSGKVEIWTYVLHGVLHQFLFVDEYLNGNPRIPYSMDVLLSYLRHSSNRSLYRPRAAAIPGIVDATAFRDDAMNSSVYIAMSVDADSLRRAVDLSTVNHLLVRGAWFDDAWRRVGSFSDSLWTSDVPERRVGPRRVRDVVRRIALPFGRFHLACAMQDDGGKARAVVRADADASRFMRSDLTLSDIMLVRESGPASCAVNRPGARVWPRVGRTYATGQTLRVYVEIYNLSTVAHLARYDVRFSIYPARDDDTPVWEDWGRRAAALVGLFESDPVIAQTFTREGRGHSGHELIGIDVDSLPAGPYDLVIDVVDRRTGARAVERTRFRRESTRVAGGEK